MKNKFLALIGLTLSVFSLNAQDNTTITSNFNWVSSSATAMSSTTIDACGSPIRVDLTTSTLDHGLEGTGALVPFNTHAVGDVMITLSFSSPVNNLNLHIKDLDENYLDAGDNVITNPNNTNPFEYITNFSSPFSTIVPIAGTNTFIGTGANGNTGLDPNSLNDTEGWLVWNTPVSSISFTYNREDLLTNNSVGWGLLLEAFSFTCFTPPPCTCSTENTYLRNPTSIAAFNGTLIVPIRISSNGVPITKLTISLPFYNSLAPVDCMNPSTTQVDRYGQFSTLTSISNTTPSYIGNNNGSSVLEYVFPTPTVINAQNVNLRLRLPPVLDLSCCENTVDFCIQIGMLDENCVFCDLRLCHSYVPDPTKTSSITSTNENSNGNKEVTIMKSSQFSDNNTALMLSPNPVSEQLKIELLSSGGIVSVYNLNGKLMHTASVNSKTIRLDTSSFSGGQYIVKHVYKGQVVTGKFIKS